MTNNRRILAGGLLVILLLLSGLTAVINLNGTWHSLEITAVEGGENDCFRLDPRHSESVFNDIHVQLVDDSTVVAERTIPELENGASEPFCAPRNVDRVRITDFAVNALPSESWVVITSYGKPLENGTVNQSAPRGYLETQDGSGPYQTDQLLLAIFPSLYTSLALFGVSALGLVLLHRRRT